MTDASVDLASKLETQSVTRYPNSVVRPEFFMPCPPGSWNLEVLPEIQEIAVFYLSTSRFFFVDWHHSSLSRMDLIL